VVLTLRLGFVLLPRIRVGDNLSTLSASVISESHRSSGNTETMAMYRINRRYWGCEGTSFVFFESLLFCIFVQENTTGKTIWIFNYGNNASITYTQAKI
jgi:hypothetical protein